MQCWKRRYTDKCWFTTSITVTYANQYQTVSSDQAFELSLPLPLRYVEWLDEPTPSNQPIRIKMLLCFFFQKNLVTEWKKQIICAPNNKSYFCGQRRVWAPVWSSLLCLFSMQPMPWTSLHRPWNMWNHSFEKTYCWMSDCWIMDTGWKEATRGHQSARDKRFKHHTYEYCWACQWN